MRGSVQPIRAYPMAMMRRESGILKTSDGPTNRKQMKLKTVAIVIVRRLSICFGMN